MKVITFRRHHREYTPGDVAGFSEDFAQKLLDAGIAEEYVADENDAQASAKGEGARSATVKG